MKSEDKEKWKELIADIYYTLSPEQRTCGTLEIYKELLHVTFHNKLSYIKK